MSSGPIWARSEPGERRASLSRERIAQTAVALADAEGPKALSMRRIAQELGVGTMTLYGYVKTKDELFDLVDDTIMGGLVIPEDEFPDGDWRAALEAISYRSRDNFVRHPWVLEAMGTLGNRIGPNALRHFDQTLRAMRGLDLEPLEKLDITSLVDEYVFGYAIRQLHDFGPDDSEWNATQSYVEEQLDRGEHRHILELFPEGRDRAQTWLAFHEAEQDPARFQRGLTRLLDGVEADLQRRGVL